MDDFGCGVGGAGGFEQALHGFLEGFVAEFEGGVVDGEEAFCGHGVGHGEGLFWGGVGVFPGVVRADAEDGEVDGAEACEVVGEGGVAGEECAVWCGG